MAFDKNLDQKIYLESCEFETSKIHVGVYSYNGGEMKLQLSRENRNQQNEWSFAKLGRMTKEEVEAVLPLMQKAFEAMKEPPKED